MRFILSPVFFFGFCPSYMLLMLLWPRVLPAVILHPLEQALPNPEPRGWGCAHPMHGSRHINSHDRRTL